MQKTNTQAGEIKFTTTVYNSKKKLYLLKLDVEGYEVKALQGGKNVIKRCKPIIIVEAWERNEKKIDQCLNNLNYRRMSKRLNRDIIYGPRSRY